MLTCDTEVDAGDFAREHVRVRLPLRLCQQLRVKALKQLKGLCLAILQQKANGHTKNTRSEENEDEEGKGREGREGKGREGKEGKEGKV